MCAVCQAHQFRVRGSGQAVTRVAAAMADASLFGGDGVPQVSSLLSDATCSMCLLADIEAGAPRVTLACGGGNTGEPHFACLNCALLALWSSSAADGLTCAQCEVQCALRDCEHVQPAAGGGGVVRITCAQQAPRHSLAAAVDGPFDAFLRTEAAAFVVVVALDEEVGFRTFDLLDDGLVLAILRCLPDPVSFGRAALVSKRVSELCADSYAWNRCSTRRCRRAARACWRCRARGRAGASIISSGTRSARSCGRTARRRPARPSHQPAPRMVRRW
ncbi:hypothetical protein T492DRAFT_194904 [Pavlovales sp. CCMP2436]|nr:hypothetical protein T492DRAFT_194904 [Pavlovales sp. CCMP2436]